MVEYEKMKDTGIFWIAQIPEHWKMIRNKYIMTERQEFTKTGEEPLLSLSQYTGITLRKQYDSKVGMHEVASLIGYKIVKRDDVVMNIMLAWNGSTAKSNLDGIISPAYAVFQISDTDVNPAYLHYLYKTPWYLNYFEAFSTGIIKSRLRLYPETFFQMSSVVPPRAEQDRIVRFLDWKVSEINKLIGIRRKEIQELEELKARTIDKAVIHGLHGHSEIHNDDIRWDIDYPATWELERLRNLFTFRKGLSITKANLEPTGIPVISYGQVHSKKNSMVGLNDELFKFVNPSYLQTDPSALVEKGDFIFADTSEDLGGSGNCAYIDRDGKIFAGYHSVIAHPKGSTNNKYFAYLFKSPTWRYQIRKKVNAVKVYSITQQILKDVFLLVPSQEEQQGIVQYLDSACLKIDSLIESTHKKIAELNDMKSVIISDVVTGKIDVRGVIVPEYEHVDYVASDSDGGEEESEENAAATEEDKK